MLTTAYQPDRNIRLRSTTAGIDQPTCIAPFATELNWMAVAWRDDRLMANVFGYPSRRLAELALARIPGMPQSFCRVAVEGQADDLPKWVSSVVARLQLFADGEAVDFADVPLSLAHLTSFGMRVIAACRRIPWGETRTYGELAAECGSSGAARAVGSVMAKNRYPLIVPCHRVLAAGGDLGGYSAPDGLTMKRRLLTMEGTLV
ncbi:MAG TPA: methylated-DNA--[protein]-cysteine S-methyltransferase [Lacipirellulaceae bacterium]|nr:methylated-DNA--[protein]-cysteine S-methyltransferase [Lacipirellulaceae bacterium]